MDKGTENTKVAEIHIAIRKGHNDSLSGEKSVRFGSSPTNSVGHYASSYCCADYTQFFHSELNRGGQNFEYY